MKKKKREKKAYYPFEKASSQEREDEDDEQLRDFYLNSQQELELGISETKERKRSLDEEEGAGREP